MPLDSKIIAPLKPVLYNNKSSINNSTAPIKADTTKDTIIKADTTKDNTTKTTVDPTTIKKNPHKKNQLTHPPMAPEDFDKLDHLPTFDEYNTLSSTDFMSTYFSDPRH